MDSGLAKCIRGYDFFILQVGQLHLSMDPEAITLIHTGGFFFLSFFFLFTFFTVIPAWSMERRGAFFQFVSEKWCSLKGRIFFLGQLLTIWNRDHSIEVWMSQRRENGRCVLPRIVDFAHKLLGFIVDRLIKNYFYGGWMFFFKMFYW